ncbi:MAG: hypothetical protein IKL68_02565 [Clostridia bacterium]|nr:hypothetical protein [Clostridia bacterium]
MAPRKYKKYNFNSEYKAHGYPESVWPLLNDYFSRDAAEFDLTDKEIKTKLDTMFMNLETIEIDDQPDSSNNALYKPNEKKIILNFAGMSQRNESYVAHLCTMFHEFGHVDENFAAPTPNSFMHIGANGRFKGVAFNEIHKEMRAARLTMNMRLSADMGPGADPKCMMRHVGYNDLMFIGTMMHTALGVSEREFLSAAEKGPEYFRETMSKKFSDPKTFDDFMATITFASDSIHAIKYKEGTLSTTDYRNIANLTATIYGECLSVMDARISSELQRSEADPKTFSEKTRYELERLAINYKHGITKNTPFSLEQLNELPEVSTTNQKVLAFEIAVTNRRKLGKKEYESLVEELSIEDVNIDETLNRYGLTLPSIADKPDVDTSEYKKDFLEEDYGTDYWDNKDCIESIKAMETDEQIRHTGVKVLQFRPKSNTAMDKLNALNTLDEVASYDSQLSSQDFIEVDVKTKNESPEL